MNRGICGGINGYVLEATLEEKCTPTTGAKPKNCNRKGSVWDDRSMRGVDGLRVGTSK